MEGKSDLIFSEARNVLVTRPKGIQRHEIGDEELEMLYQGGESARTAILSLSVGGLIGSLPTAVPGAVDLWLGLPLERSAIVQLIIFISCLVALPLTWFITRKTTSLAQQTYQNIKNRRLAG